MVRKISAAVLALAFVLIAACALAVPARPSSFTWAYDETGTLSRSDLDEISAWGGGLLDATGGSKTGDQVVAVIVKFLDGADGADYATDIINDWGLGDNSVVILLSVGDRDIQVAAGKGLDRLLSAKARGELIDENIDYFANNQFADGMVVLYEAVCRRVATLRGKTLSVAGAETGTAAGAIASPGGREDEGGFGMTLLGFIIFAVVIFLIIRGFRGNRRRRVRQAPPPPAGGLFGGPAAPRAPRRPVGRGNMPPPPPSRPARGGGYFGGAGQTPPAPQRPAGRGVTPPSPRKPSGSGGSDVFRSLGGLFGGSGSSRSSSSSSSSRSSSSSSRSSSSGSFGRSGGSRGSSTGRKF